MSIIKPAFIATVAAIAMTMGLSSVASADPAGEKDKSSEATKDKSGKAQDKSGKGDKAQDKGGSGKEQDKTPPKQAPSK